MALLDQIGFLGRRVPVIEKVGDNSANQFIHNLEWACVVEFPAQESQRARAAGLFLESALESIATKNPYLFLDVHFAFKNHQAAFWEAGKGNPLSGHSLKIQLYRKGELVAETNDAVIWHPLKLIDGEVFTEDGALLLGYDGKYYGITDCDIDTKATVTDSVSLSALEQWLIDNGIALEPQPLDRARWECLYHAQTDEISCDLA